MLQGSILQQLRDIHNSGQPGQQPLNFGVYYKNTLVALCHALEDSVLAESDCKPLIISAFQRGKWYLQEAERYADLARHSREIVIMAASEAGFQDHTTGHLSNVNLVELGEQDPVAQEWHLIIVSPHYTAMVLCQELSDADYGITGVPTDDLSRKFYGFWTFEPGLVMETAALAIAHLDRYDSGLKQRLNDHLKDIRLQAQQQDAPCCSPTADRLGGTVSRVVDYLQTCYRNLGGQSPDLALSASTVRGLDSNLISNELQAFLRISELIDQTDLSNPMAGAEVASLAEAVGQLLDLPAWQLHRLRLAGLLHRIGFLKNTDPELSAGISSRYDDDVDQSVPLTCPLVPGAQMLRTMPRLRAIATIIAHQTESWDGTGQPARLIGDAIPLESRILGLVSEFQHRVARLKSEQSILGSGLESAECLAAAMADFEAEAGSRWDPKLIELLSLLVRALSQGLSLSVSTPKIASGLWLLDSHSGAANAPNPTTFSTTMAASESTASSAN